MAEHLRVTYAPPGENPIIDYVPRERTRTSATRADGRLIAGKMLEYVPGTQFADHWIRVDRVEISDAPTGEQHVRELAPLLSWEGKTRKSYERAVHQLTHSRSSELAPIRKAARKSGKESVENDRKANGADRGFTWGRWRARFRAWSPLLSENYAVAGAATGLGIAYEHPYLVAGLGKDAHDLTHELLPGHNVEELQENIEGVLRRLQDSVLDPADIVHGIGKGLVRIIQEHQKGVGGVFLALSQAEIPVLGEAIEVIMNVESLTSPDRKRSKISLGAYDLAETHALQTKLAKNANKRRFLPFGKHRDALTHRLLWAPTSVVATELDRRSERQDRIDMEYIRMILEDPDASNKPLAYQRYRQDLALALTRALNRPRTQQETFERKLSGDSSEMEARAIEKLQEVLPPAMWSVVQKGLAILGAKREQRPQDYRDALQTLKASETTQSYLQYAQTLLPIAQRYAQDGRSYMGKDRILWEQAASYTGYLLDLADTAQAVAPHTRRRSASNN